MRINRTTVAFLITCGFASLAGTPVTADENESRIVETMLLYQRDSSGWPKNYDADAMLDDDAKAKVLAEKRRTDTTFDNGATQREVRALSQAYARTGDDRFKAAARRGIRFMLDAQYAHGGWPQSYPEPEGYAKHITFNDGAMIGVMTVLRDIAAAKAPSEIVDDETRTRAVEAVDKGIESSGTGSRHLVLDDRKIASTSNVKLALGKINKHPANPLFGEDKPWEQRFDNFYGSIVYEEDEKLYRLWWNPFIYDPDEGADERENGLEYAYSSDGIQWTKPNLGLVEYEGSAKNNLINRDSGHGHGVFKDSRESDPTKRYKMIARENGVSTAYSADGLHWSDWMSAFKAKADTHNNAIWAPTLNKYVAISREFVREGKERRRVVARSESDSFLSGWSDVEIVMDGGSEFQTYANTIFHHAGVYLGLVAIFDTSDGPADNKVWTELAWSPDTKRWHRLCEGTPFIPNSDVEGAPDWGTAYACLNPLFRDTDEVRIYYGGGDGKHNRYRDGYLMLATIRKDRWAGYEAVVEGTIETVPVKCDGVNLFVCADVKPGGSIRAEILGADSFSAKDCKPVTMDVSDGKLAWSEKNLKNWIGSKITLRFHLNQATLYSFLTK